MHDSENRENWCFIKIKSKYKKKNFGKRDNDQTIRETGVYEIIIRSFYTNSGPKELTYGKFTIHTQ